MKGMNYIQTKQIQWAKRHKLTLTGSKGERGLPIYAESINHNLFTPLTDENKIQFKDGDGNEINDKKDEPAKMRALHSSSAIAVNFFQYWQQIDKIYQIAHACGLCNEGNQSSEKSIFEKKYSIDKAFQFAPNIDVVIENSKQSRFRVFAIECKFSEAYGSYGHNGIDPKYLELIPLWEDIPEIYNFAKTISPDDNEFKHLHPAQLVKHILGLKKAYGKKAFRLLYLWYDVHGEESSTHRKEIEIFSNIAKSDGIKFQSISYQKLISNLATHYYEGNEEYLNYISDRYL